MNATAALRSFLARLFLIGAVLFAPISSLASSGAANVGQSVTFSVTVNGTAPFTYQWYKNSSSVSGAVGATYTLSSITTGDAGTYYVIVGNSAGSTTSDNATLTVNQSVTAPAITSQPAAVTVNAGQSASFAVAASGTAPLSYQWRKNGAAIAGATSATYTISATATTDAGSYSVVVSNTAGSVTSNAVALTLNVAPAITSQPVAASVTSGQPATFSVVASGTAPLTYQWRKDGATIAGATSATYMISATTTASAGNYSVVVSNVAGSAASNNAALNVNQSIVAPAITSQPVAITVTAGQSASFAVAASGTAPLSYQWRKNGAAIAGATNAIYSIGATASADAGSYSVVVSNTAVSVTSNAVALTVNVAPSITTQPAAVSATVGQSASFTVVATGTPSLSYQWLKNGVNLLGANSATYSISATASTDAGSYSVLVSNPAGSIASNAVALTVNLAPSITSQPAAVTVTAGQPATFSVVAGGTGPLSYQWRKNGAAIAGATSATYSISATASTDAGNFSVVVTNAAGSATSNNAALTVNPAPVAPSITTQPAAASVTAGDPVSFAVVASGTGPLTYQWLKNGSAIAGATSATYTINATASADAGNYSVVVTNSAGSTTSTAAVLTVTAAKLAPSSLVEMVPTSYSARGQNYRYPVSALFDGNNATKWLDSGGATWVKVTVATPSVLEAYSLTSAPDYPARDPASWTLSGSNDGVSWTVLETRSGQTWTSRGQTRDFALDTPSAAFTQFRFDFTVGAGASTQLAELELFKVETPGAEAPSSMVQLTPASYSARGQNGTREGLAKLFDGNVTTKWLDFSGTTWVQVNLAAPASLVAYGLASANDAAQRDPASWTLSGSNDGVTWTVIETRSGQAWSSRYLTRDFVLAQASVAYQSFRFEFTATSGSITQLAELDLFGY